MKTVIYNSVTNSARVYENGYTIDGILQPLGELAENVFHLQHVRNNAPEYDTFKEQVTYEWMPDYDTNEYVQVWTIHDKDDTELAEYITQQSERAEQAAKDKLIKKEIEVKYQENLTAINVLTDTEALEKPDEYLPFKIGKVYGQNERFYYPINQKLYKVLQAHTSAAQWLPTEAVSLYVEVTPENVIAAWVQPLGAQDAYQIGDKVTFGGFTWQSTAANNVWQPGVYGWVKI